MLHVHLNRLGGCLAWAATLNLMLLFYPVPRSSFLHWMLGQNFEMLIKYHKCGQAFPRSSARLLFPLVKRLKPCGCRPCRWIGNWLMILLTLHGWCFWASWLWEGIYIRGLYWDTYGSNMLAGALSWFAGAALWVTSLSYVRRHYFEVRGRAFVGLSAWMWAGSMEVCMFGASVVNLKWLACRCSTAPTLWPSSCSCCSASSTISCSGLTPCQVWCFISPTCCLLKSSM